VTIDSERVPAERRLSLGAIVVVAFAMLALPLLHLCNRQSARRTLAVLARLGRPSWTPLASDPIAVGRSVGYASRVLRLHDTTCLARSQLVWLLLSVGGMLPVIRVGAGAGFGAGALAHAWVELDGVPIADAADVATQHPPFDRPLLEPAH
jgi:hypothetical protein